MTRIKYLTLAALAAIFMLSLGHGASGQVGRSQLINPDLATEKDLLTLPHMNAALVKALIEQRPFPNMHDLNTLLAKSLNQNQLSELYGKLFVQINLNTAKDDEISMIPGMGKRMLREFLEYRPYRTMAQFRKEIGKYVDDKEVARLEQYVFVPIDLNTASDEDILTIPVWATACCANSRNIARTRISNSSAKRSASTSTRKKWPAWSAM